MKNMRANFSARIQQGRQPQEKTRASEILPGVCKHGAAVVGIKMLIAAAIRKTLKI
jgi:hypothetical protein